MRRWFLIVTISAALSGCAAWERGPPTCDGGDKRPINAGKWSGALSLACGGAN